jgi:hypothetical protein
MTPEERNRVIDEAVAAFEHVSDVELENAFESSSLITQTLDALRQERVVPPTSEPVVFELDDEIQKLADVLTPKAEPTVAEAKKSTSSEMDRIRAILKEKTTRAPSAAQVQKSLEPEVISASDRKRIVIPKSLEDKTQ